MSNPRKDVQKFDKMDTNSFIAYKSVFNKELNLEVNTENYDGVNEIVNEDYHEETEGNFYEKVEIDFEKIHVLYDKYAEQELEEDDWTNEQEYFIEMKERGFDMSGYTAEDIREILNEQDNPEEETPSQIQKINKNENNMDM